MTFFTLYIKDNRYIVRCRGKIYQKMPHQMVVTKSLHSIEYGTYGVEYSAQSDKEDKLPRGVT